MKWWTWIILALLVGYAASTQSALYEFRHPHIAYRLSVIKSACDKVGVHFEKMSHLR